MIGEAEPATQPPVDAEAMLDRLFEAAGGTQAPGLVVGIAGPGGFRYRRGFGLASVQQGVPNTPATRVRIASISKQFTCALILLLAQDGVVALDAPVSTYLSDLAPPLGRATLRQLMTHTGGWRCTLELGSIANGYAAQPAEWQALALRRQRDVLFEPGAGQLYCNGGYVALGEAVERRTGQTLASLLEARLFTPLGMFDTALVEDDMRMTPGLADAHVRDGTGWRRPPADAPLRGDGGVVSTVDDMLRWLAHLRDPRRLGGAAVWRELAEPCRLANGFASTYALGIKRHRYRGVEVLQHSGGLFGLNAQAITVPARGLDVVVVVNGAPLSATALAFAAVDRLLEGELTGPSPLRARTERHSQLVGCAFALPDGLLLRFRDLDGVLGLSQMAMAPSPVLYEDARGLYATFEEIGFGPLVWSPADLAEFRTAPGRGLPVMIAGERRRLEALPPNRAALAYAAGRYASEALAAQATIAVQGDGLAMRLKGDCSASRDFAGETVAERRLAIVSTDGEERYAVELDPDQTGVCPGFWIDTHRARRVRFDRVGHLE